jgi:superoxide dismutase
MASEVESKQTDTFFSFFLPLFVLRFKDKLTNNLTAHQGNGYVWLVQCKSAVILNQF